MTKPSDNLPLPGRPVPGSRSGRPVMAALALLSRRWVLRILWEMREGPMGFRELRARCEGMSPDTLSTRLGELREAGLIERTGDGALQLTPLGEGLTPTLHGLAQWADDWEAALGPPDKPDAERKPPG